MPYYKPLAARGLSITGLDPNTEMRAYSEQSARDEGLADAFRFVEGQAGTLPFADAAYDAVVITLVSRVKVAVI